MRLKYARIVNFRSIHDVRIDFDPTCRILVGINESGKSNILRALSMIGSEFPLTAEDIREPLPRETPITQAHIWFVFALALQRSLTKNPDHGLFKHGGKTISFRDFCLLKKECLYVVNLLDQSKAGSYWGIGSEYTATKNWMKPSASCPPDFSVTVGGKSLPLKTFLLVDVDDYPQIPAAYLTPADAFYINNCVGSQIRTLVEKSLPKVIFWRYDERNLLPPAINMDTFGADPDTCVPLKNMFMLAGVSQIGAELARARQGSPNKVRNLLRRVATHTTAHFRNVWKEYREISFALEPNASMIEANVVEKNYWRMSQRSDGAKRFITFLLYISANIKANLLSNAILLIDEPDMGLHPSGSRYLRDELIENSQKNYVVFSTHSIFMIDKQNIGRHAIVSKNAEKTTILNANTSNFVDEEVLFNALNYTVFDILQSDNIIFEGWRDKRLFQTALKKIPTAHAKQLKALKDRLKSLGLCHAEGVKDIRNITPLLELASRRCLIISDADAPAKEKQREYRAIRGYGTWKRYDEVLTGTIAETAEDFLTAGAFDSGLRKLKQKYPVLVGEPSLETSKRIAAIKGWLGGQSTTVEERRKMLQDLKEFLFDEIKSSDIDTSYYDFLERLAPLLGSKAFLAEDSEATER